MFESTDKPVPRRLSPEELAQRQREWEAEEVSISKSCPSMFKPIHQSVKH